MSRDPVVPDGYRDPRTGLPVRKALQRRAPLRRTPATGRVTDQGSSSTEPARPTMPRRTAPIARSAPKPGEKAQPPRRTPIKAQSARQARKVAARTEVKRAIAADVETMSCQRCHAEPVHDWHEVLSRARGGSITDLDNAAFLGRACHRWITEHPTEAEAEGWSRSA